MNPNESPPPHESAVTPRDDRGEGGLAGAADSPRDYPPLRSRAGWHTLLRIAPAILSTIAYAALEHQYYSRGGRDALNSLSNGLLLLPLGLIASVVVGVLSAGWAVRDRPPQRSAALVWVGTFILVILLNTCLMFGGCLTVARLRST